MHSGAASWRGGGQHKPAYRVRPDESDLLGNEAADREPQEVNERKVQRVEKVDSVARHLLDLVRCYSGRDPDTDVVERDDAPLGAHSVDEWRVPIIEVAPEVLQQHQRHRAGADFTVGVVDAVVGMGDLIGSGVIAALWLSPVVVVISTFLPRYRLNEGVGRGVKSQVQAVLPRLLVALIHQFS
jgi:hypothetical protein